MTTLLLALLGCRAPGGVVPDDSARPDTAPSDTGETAGDTAEDTAEDTADDTDTADTSTQVEPCEVSPSLADPDGGGGRVVIAVATSVGVTGASLGGAPLTDFAVDDVNHISGVPGPHEAGVVDVEVLGDAPAACAAAFEYWSPTQIAGVSTVLDAAKGVTEEGGTVATWTDQGPDARAFTQADAALRPTFADDAFGAMPGLRFTPPHWLKLAAPVPLVEGSSIFAVARWTATTDVTPPPGNPGNVPLTLVGDGTNGYGAFGAAGGSVVSNHYVGGPVFVEGGENLNDGVARLIGATVDTTTVTRIYVGNAQQGVDHTSAPMIGLNTYDTIGAGHPGADGWDGDVGAVVIVAGEIHVADRTRLDRWATQRFGTPASAPLDPWTRTTLAELPAEWFPRDGAQMVQLASGRVLMIGGWSPYDPWGAGDRTTNEVWASDDSGETWELLLAHDPAPPTSGAGARFPPGHTVGVTTWQGHAVVLGTDCLSPPLTGDVWVESDDGATWTRVTTDAPTAGRCLHMAGTLGDDLYVMGGQTDLYDASTAVADAWRSSDGGVTWARLDDPPWSGRGMVYRPVELDGRLYVVGGGLYDETTPVAFDGVYAFDGTTWTTVLPDGHAQWEASYYNALAASNGRLWLFNGYTGIEELSRALYSDDGGATWSELAGGSGGGASHADAVVDLGDRVIRVSGDLGARSVYAFWAP